MNQATPVLADTALLRCTVNELAATFGTAERTHTPARSCCKVASTRLAAVSVTPVLVAEDAPAATVRVPLRENTVGPCTLSAVFPVARTPVPDGHSPSTPMPVLLTPCAPVPLVLSVTPWTPLLMLPKLEPVLPLCP